jgi:hypothetical protein
MTFAYTPHSGLDPESHWVQEIPAFAGMRNRALLRKRKSVLSSIYVREPNENTA